MWEVLGPWISNASFMSKLAHEIAFVKVSKPNPTPDLKPTPKSLVEHAHSHCKDICNMHT